MNPRGPSRRPSEGQARISARRPPAGTSAGGGDGAGPSAPAAPSRGRQSQSNKGDPGSPIDVEEIEDDVELLPPFPHARNQPRRRRPPPPPVTVDLEEDVVVLNPVRSGVPSEEPVILSSVNAHTKRVRTSSSGARKDVMKSPTMPKKAVPEELTFTCPICMSPLVEASSTICGHIFCQSCIKLSIQALKKCPICKRKLGMNNFHRVYLPAGE